MEKTKLLFAIVFFLSGYTAPITAQPALFAPVKSAALANATAGQSNPPADRERIKRFAVVALANQSYLDQPSIILNLFTDKYLKINRKSFDEKNSIKEWRGTVEGDSLSSVIIFYSGGWVSGRVSKGKELYTFNVFRDGNITIMEIDLNHVIQPVDLAIIK